MRLFSRAAGMAILAFALGFPPTVRAGSLGRRLGTFALDVPRAALAKPGASVAYPLPPEGRRQRVMAAVSESFEARSLDAYGWRLVNLYKGFAVLEGEPATLRLLYEAPGILEIRPPRPVHPTMDAARALSRIDGILNWGPVPNSQGVNGKGVIVGLVDFGFDTHHPAFLDTAGKTRFLGIWDPNLPKENGAPFGLGQVRNQAQLQADAAFGQNEHDVHGTHVASCAAGSGPGNPFYGAAPGAYLLGVNLSTKNKANDFESNVANGIQWMFQVADSLKMPCVVNLSLSTGHFGPHDGTSLFDRFLDSLVGPGRIVVGAMGNDGDKRLHAGFDLGATDTAGAFAALPLAVGMWGQAGKPFKFEVLLVDTVSHDYTVSSAYISTATVRTRPIFDTVTWTDPGTGKTVRLAVTFQTERLNSGNGRPHAELIVEAAGNDSLAVPQGLWAGFRMVGPGRVHVWNGAGTPFRSLGIKGFRDGDNEYSLCEMGGTSKSVLSVGAYASKTEVVDYKGVAHADILDQEVGELAPWSGRGPTLDGRIKPDVCAPGRRIMGALSSAVTDPAKWWQIPLIGIWPDPGQLSGRFVAVEGTSQAAPIAAGVVALMLELDPGLTPAQVKSNLIQTASRDAFTGDLASPGPDWGHGKLDASAAIQKVRPTPVSAGHHPAQARARVWARFAQGNLYVTGLEAEGPVVGRIVDWRGRTLSGPKSVKAGRMEGAGSLRPGVYFAVIKSGRASYRMRFFKD